MSEKARRQIVDCLQSEGFSFLKSAFQKHSLDKKQQCSIAKQIVNAKSQLVCHVSLQQNQRITSKFCTINQLQEMLKTKRQQNVACDVIDMQLIAIYISDMYSFTEVLEKIDKQLLLAFKPRPMTERRQLFVFPPYVRFRGQKYETNQNNKSQVVKEVPSKVSKSAKADISKKIQPKPAPKKTNNTEKMTNIKQIAKKEPSKVKPEPEAKRTLKLNSESQSQDLYKGEDIFEKYNCKSDLNATCEKEKSEKSLEEEKHDHKEVSSFANEKMEVEKENDEEDSMDFMFKEMQKVNPSLNTQAIKPTVEPRGNNNTKNVSNQVKQKSLNPFPQQKGSQNGKSMKQASLTAWTKKA